MAPCSEIPNVSNCLGADPEHIRHQLAFPAQWIYIGLKEKHGLEAEDFPNQALVQDGALVHLRHYTCLLRLRL